MITQTECLLAVEPWQREPKKRIKRKKNTFSECLLAVEPWQREPKKRIKSKSGVTKGGVGGVTGKTPVVTVTSEREGGEKIVLRWLMTVSVRNMCMGLVSNS
jgi:hypothetical protein